MSILHSPISLRSLKLKNRLVLPPMATAKCGDSGAVTDALCEYYDEKTKGGMIGLVITEHCFISPEGKAGAGQMSIASDDLIPGLKKLTDVIHANGSPVIAQINHAGISAKSEITGLPVIGPSSVPHPTRPAADVLPVEMTLEDIERVKAAFVKAALRAKEAGFDGVEIHSAHSYLLNQFYSPLTNHRTDAYGGSLENRIRLHLEIIEAVREAVGKSYIIAIRLGGCDYMEGGSTIEEAAAACKAFALAGADLLDISGGFCSYRHPTSTEPGYFKDMTLAVKKACPKTPVILTGGVTTGEQAEALLQEYVADMIGVGRAILQDSNWAFTNLRETWGPAYFEWLRQIDEQQITDDFNRLGTYKSTIRYGSKSSIGYCTIYSYHRNIAYIDHPVVKYITFDSTGNHLDNTFMGIVNVHFCDGSEATWQSKYFDGFNVGQMGISITPDGTKIFAQTWETGLYCFDIRTGEKLWRTKSRAGITDMHVNRNGTICAHKHYRALQLIDIETGEVLKEKTPARSWGFQILDENRILCQTKARLCEIIDPATLDTIDSFHPFDLDHLHQYAKSIRHKC